MSAKIAIAGVADAEDGSVKSCAQCGASLRATAKFCDECGGRQDVVGGMEAEEVPVAQVVEMKNTRSLNEREVEERLAELDGGTFSFSHDGNDDDEEGRVECLSSETGVMLTVKREKGHHGTVSVRVTTRDGSAKAGTHYVRLEEVVVFEQGETEKSVFVALTDAAGDGGLTREFACALEIVDFDAVIHYGARRSITVCVRSTAAGTLYFTRNTYAYAHPQRVWGLCTPASARTVALKVTRTNGAHGAVAVRYAVRAKDAKADGADGASGDHNRLLDLVEEASRGDAVLAFKDGETEKTVDVAIPGPDDAGGEAFVREFEVELLELEGAPDAAVGERRRATVRVSSETPIGWREYRNPVTRGAVWLVMLVASAWLLHHLRLNVMAPDDVEQAFVDAYEPITFTSTEARSYENVTTCHKVHACATDGQCKNISTVLPECDPSSRTVGEWPCHRPDCCLVALGPCEENCWFESEHHHSPHHHSPHGHSGGGMGGKGLRVLGQEELSFYRRPTRDPGRDHLDLLEQRSNDFQPKRGLLERFSAASAEEARRHRARKDEQLSFLLGLKIGKEENPSLSRALSHKGLDQCLDPLRTSNPCNCPDDRWTRTPHTWTCTNGAPGGRRLGHTEELCRRSCDCTSRGSSQCTSTSGSCLDRLKKRVSVSFTALGQRRSGTLPQKAFAKKNCSWTAISATATFDIDSGLADAACASSAYLQGETIEGFFLRDAVATSGADVPRTVQGLEVLVGEANPLMQFCTYACTCPDACKLEAIRTVLDRELYWLKMKDANGLILSIIFFSLCIIMGLFLGTCVAGDDPCLPSCRGRRGVPPCPFIPLEVAAFLSFIIGVAKGILPADFSNSEVAEIMTSYDLSYYEGSKRNKEAALYHCSSALWTDECEEGAAARDASTGALALVALALVASALAPR